MKSLTYNGRTQLVLDQTVQRICLNMKLFITHFSKILRFTGSCTKSLYSHNTEPNLSYQMPIIHHAKFYFVTIL
jgi:hypothetical protein